jgi:RNA polymerase sigma-70 factor (ECF subfamily)
MTRSTDAAARFEYVAQIHGERLMGYLVRRIAADEAPDVAAQTLTTAWRRVRLMPTDDQEALWWLLAIARRTLANHRRGLVRRQALAERLRAARIVAAPPAESESIKSLTDAVVGLAEDDQELIRLVYWDGLSTKAAGEILGIGDAAARKRLQRARQALRRAIGDIGIGALTS